MRSQSSRAVMSIHHIQGGISVFDYKGNQPERNYSLKPSKMLENNSFVRKSLQNIKTYLKKFGVLHSLIFKNKSFLIKTK